MEISLYPKINFFSFLKKEKFQNVKKKRSASIFVKQTTASKSGPGNKILLHPLVGFSEREFVGVIKQPFIFVTRIDEIQRNSTDLHFV